MLRRPVRHYCLLPVVVPMVLVLSRCTPSRGQASGHSAVEMIGGEPVTAADTLAQTSVALFRVSDDSAHHTPFCSGVLVANRWILTVAHCATDPRVKVVFGLGSRPHVVERLGTTVRHPAYGDPYNEWNHFDVALIRLESDAPSFTKPAAWAETSTVKPGALLTIAGYGQTDADAARSMPPPQPLLKAVFQLSQVASMDEIEAQGVLQFRALKEGQSPCSGDSGGGIFVQTPAGLRLAGLVLGGYDCQRGEGYATNVLFWRSWIQETMAK